MNAVLGTLQFSLMALAFFLVLGAIISAVFYRPLINWLGKQQPGNRGSVLSAWIAMPLGLALVLTLATFSPSLFGLIGLVADHCETHSVSHPHLCLVHPPVPVDNILAWILKALVLSLGIAFLTGICRMLVRSWQQTRTLLAHSQYDQSLHIYRLNTQLPLALCAGVWSPRVFISHGLLPLLSDDQLQVVLAHEQAHARRKDAMRLMIANAFSIFHLPSIRRRLLAELALACEQACDEEAALATGNRLGVAETILVVERHSGMAVGPALAFVPHPTIARVEALLAPPRPDAAQIPWLVATALTLLIIPLVLGQPLHHLTEILLGLLTR